MNLSEKLSTCCHRNTSHRLIDFIELEMVEYQNFVDNLSTLKKAIENDKIPGSE